MIHAIWMTLQGITLSEKGQSKRLHTGNSLAVQWLGLRTFIAKGPGSIPGQGTRIPQDAWHSQKKKNCHYPVIKSLWGASLVAQWLRICLPMQGTRVRALVWEDPTCRGATKPVSHNY